MSLDKERQPPSKGCQTIFAQKAKAVKTSLDYSDIVPVGGVEPAHSADSKGLVGRPRISLWASTGRAPSAGQPTAWMIRTNLRFFFAGPVFSATEGSGPDVAGQIPTAALERLSSHFRKKAKAEKINGAARAPQAGCPQAGRRPLGGDIGRCGEPVCYEGCCSGAAS